MKLDWKYTIAKNARVKFDEEIEIHADFGGINLSIKDHN